ncbi:MAG: hypothetical protein ACRC10_09330 [Thermoguttaceae bacterium]
MMKSGRIVLTVLLLNILLTSLLHAATKGNVDDLKQLNLQKATIRVSPNVAAQHAIAPTVLQEEIAKKTGLKLKTTDVDFVKKPVAPCLVLATPEEYAGLYGIPTDAMSLKSAMSGEGYVVQVESGTGGPVVWILGSRTRGLLFGIGEFFRVADWGKNRLEISPGVHVERQPVYPIRGHQLGFRAAANSWDAWTAEQFDQYVRDMVISGNNAIEGIPFQDERIEPLMKMTRDENNVLLSELCQKYDVDYWVWTPITVDLKDAEKRQADLETHETFYKKMPRLDHVFFPGGDPGDNEPQLVFPFLEEIAVLLKKYHPNAKIWLSNQGFSREGHEFVYEYLNKNMPDWFAGLVNGPSSAPISIERNHLPEKYQLRLYPDICHNKICQYPVPWWDMAFALTLGREAINPRPTQYAQIHNWFAPYSDGFLSYSDGVNDDVNKMVWTELAFEPNKPIRDILRGYSNIFFGNGIGEEVADGLLALEKNWRGPLLDNASVEGTLLYWQQLEKKHPELLKNWRFQMCLVRAYYDAYVRRRLIEETALENEVNRILADCENVAQSNQEGSACDTIMDQALEVLARAGQHKTTLELRERIIQLYDELFKSIQLQSSVQKYGASGAERGASLDFIDLPLNNRYWLEDQFAEIRQLESETEKCNRLKEIACWENPGPGSFYDDIGHPRKSDHVVHAEEIYTMWGEEAYPIPLQWWLNNGQCRMRLSQQVTLDYPDSLVYEGLDPNGEYVFRAGGFGKLRVEIDGEAVEPVNPEKIQVGQYVEFPVDPKFLADRRLEITWIEPTDEDHLNWRQKTRLSDVWLIKRR